MSGRHFLPNAPARPTTLFDGPIPRSPSLALFKEISLPVSAVTEKIGSALFLGERAMTWPECVALLGCCACVSFLAWVFFRWLRDL